MGHHEPVTDWATDFDHTDDAWAADPFPIWDELRETLPGRPLRSLRRGVAADPPRRRRRHRLRHRALHVAQRHRQRVPAADGAGARGHRAADLVRPAVPQATPAGCCCRSSRRRRSTSSSRRPGRTARSCSTAIDGRDVVDAAEDYAQHIPVRVIANMLGLPEEDADLFRGFVNHVLEGVVAADGGAGRGDAWRSSATCRTHIDDHHRQPARRPHHASCSSPSSTASKLDPFHVGRTIGLLLIAGIDTTWSAIGASIWHLAKTPGRPRAARRRARAAADGHGGAAAGLRPGDHGPPRAARTWTGTAAR